MRVAYHDSLIQIEFENNYDNELNLGTVLLSRNLLKNPFLGELNLDNSA